MEKTEDSEMKASLALVQDILRKKIIVSVIGRDSMKYIVLQEADFILMEGQYQCKQIENEIRQISNKHHIPDLNSHVREIFLLYVDC